MRASTANSGSGSSNTGGLGPVRSRGGRSARSVVSTSGDSSATANSNQQRLWVLQQQQQQQQAQAQAHPRYGFAATAAPPPAASGDHAHLYSAWRATPTPPPPPPAQPPGYGLAGYGYLDAAGYSQPPQPLQPRPPTQSNHAQLSLSQSQQLPAHGPPQSARGRAGGSRAQPPRPHTHDDSSPSRSGTAASAAPAGGSVSLHEKVAAALQELESIKSNSFRPSTAGPFGGGGGGAGGGWGDGALPRPNLSAAPSAAAAAAAAASASGAARAASLAESRTAAELRTAKSIVKKLYKRNVKLMQELNLMRSNGGAAPSERSEAERGQGRFALEESESQLLEEGAHDASAGAAGDGAAGEGASGEERDGAEDDEEDDAYGSQGGAVDGAISSPRGSRRACGRARGHSSSNGATSDKSSSIAGAGSGVGVGGPSHLLFLLGERDTALNKQQSLIASLQRKVHALQARLDLAQAHGPKRSAATAAASAAAAAGAHFDDGEDDAGVTASGGNMDRFHSQLSSLRASLSSRLRAQLSQLLYSVTTGGGGGGSGEAPALHPRVAAYISDLEQSLVWEASGRAVEKSALNAQCLRAEKMAQDSWVRSRLLESEVHELQQRLQQQDAKTRAIDTQLAAALERNKLLDGEIVRLRK